MDEQKTTAERSAAHTAIQTNQSYIPVGSMAQPGGAAPSPMPPREVYPKRRALGRDLTLAAVLLGLCFLLWDALCWARGLGLAEAAALAGILPTALIYLKDRSGTLTRYGVICAGLYLLSALSLILSGDASMKLLTLCVMVLLFQIVLLERLTLRTGTGLFSRIHDHLSVCFSMSFCRLGVGAWALTHSGTPGSVRSKRNRSILLGLLCAIPALAILIPLLISSDAAFEGLVGSLDWEFGGRALYALGFGGFAALLLFTLLFTSNQGPKKKDGVVRKGVEPAAVAGFLGIIGAVYALYLLSQFAYFTDAFRGLLPKGFTVAEYARRGFFEMCWIVAINLFLFVLALGLCRKDGGRIPGAIKALALFLCVFSLILVATALSKMILYVRSFGLTRLRLTTSVFMVFLALVVLAVALRLFAHKLPVAQLAVTLGAVILIGLSLANVDGLVARYNVDAWRSGKLYSLDIQMICYLGDGAVPVLDELAHASTDAALADKARDELERRRPLTDLRSWNLVTQEANEVLKRFGE